MLYLQTPFRPIAAAILILVTASGSPASADSAVAAASSPQMVLAYSYNHADLASARQDAIGRCTSSGGSNCDILIACTDPGYGSIYVYSAGIGALIESVGASCGAADASEAARGARRYCEYRLAVDRTGLSVRFEDTSFEMVRDILARNCGGLGNCQCSERFQWRDDR